MNDLPVADPLPEDALIRLDEVLKRIPVSRSSYYAGQKLGLYVAPISIGPRARAYRYSEIRAWLLDPAAWQAAQRRKLSEANQALARTDNDKV